MEFLSNVISWWWDLAIPLKVLSLLPLGAIFQGNTSGTGGSSAKQRKYADDLISRGDVPPSQATYSDKKSLSRWLSSKTK